MTEKPTKNRVNYIDLVAEFHKLMQQPVLPAPKLPLKQRRKLRVSLIQEELNELAKAFNDDNLVEVLDALADLQYVLSGTILEVGMQNIFDDAFIEVHRSNMSKACSTEQEAFKTIDYYKRERGVDAYAVQFNGKWFVKRMSDNKQLKSINYSPANLMQFLDDSGRVD